MRLRKLALAVGLASAFGAEVASALGLGEIQLKSTLNEPLDAEIKLLNTKELSADEILVHLASSDDFQRAGVDRLYFLTSLKFQVDLDNPAGPVVYVTTRKPVTEPYLNFLVQTQWPSGNLLREYTLLMDLPAFSDEKVRPVQSTESSRRSSRTQTSNASSVSSRSAAPERIESVRSSTSSRTNYGSDVYGPTTGSDTLWEIALKVRPDRSVSVQQTMLALQRSNPDAFINGNINLLKRGQVLRIPTRSEIADLTVRQAISEVARQNTDWSGNASGQIAGAQLEGSRHSGSRSSSSEEVRGRVKLGVDSDSSTTARAAGDGQGSSEALENELAITLEELDKSNRENAELKSRIRDLESQIETMERLVEVTNDKMRALQLSEQGAQPIGEESQTDVGGVLDDTVTDEPADESLIADESATDTADESAAELADNSDVAQPVEPKVAEPIEVKPQAVEKPKVVRPAPKPEKGIVELLMDNIIYVGGGALVLILGVFALLRRRQNAKAFEEFDAFEEEQAEDGSPELAAEPSIDEALEELDLEPEAEALLEGDDAAGDDVSIEAETEDVVGEADIYIAYGKYDQAEQMLTKALDKDPAQVPVLLKLLEVYAESNNLSGFDDAYSRLLPLDDSAANQRAEDLRRQFADAPEFVAAQASSESLSGELDALLAEEPAGQDEGLDLALNDGELNTSEPEAEQSVESEFEGLDFSLDSESGASSTEDAPELDLSLDLEGDGDSAEDFSLDLDLDDALLNSDSAEVAEDLDLELPELSAEVEAAAPESSDDELAIELDSDLDAADSKEDFDLSFDQQEPLAESGLGDLNLDGDLLAGESESADAVVPDSNEADDFDFALDLDETTDTNFSAEVEVTETLNEDLSELDLETGEDELEIPELSGDFDLDSDDSLDLSLSDEPVEQVLDAEAIDDKAVVESGVVADEAEPAELSAEIAESQLEQDAEEVSAHDLTLDDSDELDLETDLGDVDLAALDAGFDDLDGSAAEPEPASVEASVEQELEELEDLSLEDEVEIEGLDQDAEDLPDLSSEDFSAEGLAESADEDMDAELDFLADTDEAATKLDLARAYMDMGDNDGAKDILDEVLQEGNDTQKSEAKELLERIG